ncbi:MAG: hypothetical protein IPK82_21545 [Polyangiaceae bacterium]|nr:hypothetical protein [Polyangiaceae bacterium]
MTSAKDLAKHLRAAFDRIASMPDGTWKTSIQTPLGALLDTVEGLGGPPNLDAVTRAVSTLAQRATVLAGNHALDLETLQTVARAYGESLRCQALLHPSVGTLPTPTIPTLLVAEPERVVLKSPVRDVFLPASVSSAATTTPLETVTAAPENDDLPSPFDDFKPAPAALGRGQPDPDLPKGPPPVVTAIDGKGGAIDEHLLHEEIVVLALDRLSMLGRHRAERPFAARSEVEARILAHVDAMVSIGGAIVPILVGAWGRSLSSPNPWNTWAAVFALGSFSGSDILDAVEYGLLRLAPTDALAAHKAFEALACSPHPELDEFSRRLLQHPHSPCRAVAVYFLGRKQALPIDQLRSFLFDPDLTVLRAALWAARRLDVTAAEPLFPVVRKWLTFPDATVACTAASTLLAWGLEDPYRALKSGAPETSRLSQLAGEVLVRAGNSEDNTLLANLLARVPKSAATLSTLARFGHPGAWSYLTAQLGDEDLADDAANALETLFGPMVDSDERLDKSAWKSALANAKLDPSARYRRGRPWSPAVVVEELLSGELTRREMGLRLSELRSRCGVTEKVDLAAWLTDLTPALAPLTGAAKRALASYRVGSWDHKLR